MSINGDDNLEDKYAILQNYIGQELSYKQLCVLLNEEIKGGKAKQYQLRRIEQYFELCKIRQKYKIIKQYNSNEQQLITKNGQYTDILQNLLIKYIYDEHLEKKDVILTYREIMEMFSMVNKLYYEIKRDKIKYIDNFKLTKTPEMSDGDLIDLYLRDSDIFFNTSDRLLKQTINRAFDSMQSRKIILYRQSFKLYKKIKTDDNKEICINWNATKEQDMELIKLQHDCLREFDAQKMQDVIFFTRERRKQFYDELRRKMILSDILNGADTYAKTFVISFNPESIEYEYKEAWDKRALNKASAEKLLNTKSLDYLSNTMKTQFIDTTIRS